MRVVDLTKANFLPDFKLLGGASGLNKEIKMITILDAPDMNFWVRGEELLIGNGFVFKDNPAFFLEFLEQMALKNVAAVGVKFDRFLASLDIREVSAMADQLGLPVFQIPFHYRWVDVIEKVSSKLYKETGEISPTESCPSFLEEIEDPSSFLNLLSSKTGRQLFFAIQRKSWNNIPEFQFGTKGATEKDWIEYIHSEIKEEVPFPEMNSVSIWREDRDYQGGCRSIVLATKSPPFSIIYVLIQNNEERLSSEEEKIFIRAVLVLEVLLKGLHLSMGEHQRKISNIVTAGNGWSL